jgi:diguanylate cyclase (GGDEF)-like protein
VTQQTHGERQERRAKAPARLWLAVAAVAALGGGLAVAVTDRGPPPWEQRAWAWPIVGVALVLVRLWPVGLHFRRQSQTLELSGVPILVGLVMLPPGPLLLAAATAILVTVLLRKAPPIRVAFNVSNQVVGTALALLAFRAVLQGASPAHPRGWLALTAAMVAYELVTGGLVVWMVTLSNGVPRPEFFHGLATQLAILLPLDCALAIISVEAYWSEPWALVVLAGPGLALVVWYRSADRLRSRFDDLQSLYAFGRSLSEVNERLDVLRVALHEMRGVLHCRHAELCIPQPSGAVRYSLDGEGAVVRGAGSAAPSELDVTTSGEDLFLRRGTGSAYLAERGFADAIAVPVTIGAERSGVLIAAEREGTDSYTFDKADLDLLRALATHVGTALTSSSHLDRLRKEVAAREHQAYHDSLTGLANRTLFTQVVSSALKRRKGSRLVALLLMDLNGFKEVNDTLGHHAGDAVLKVIGQRVNEAVGASRLAARLGGDEFAFVIPSVVDREEVAATADELLRVVSEPVTVDGMVLSLRASIGVSLAPFHGSDVSSLLKRADIAMYAAKASSRHVTVYDPKIDRNSTRRLVLTSDLQRAVIEEKLELWYQPIAEVRTGRVAGFEALLRWPHPELGMVSPDEFIPVAEQTGLIEPLTWWVLRTAMEEQRSWRDAGYEMPMAVNVSARSLLDTAIVDRLNSLLVDTDVIASNITLEITESSMMLDFERSERILRRLSDIGVRIAIDDFGTGYSSLSRVKVLPVDVVKIDRSFVKNLCTDRGDEAIVRSTIELARIMGHGVVAEGVEDLETWNRLAQLGCTHAQGYYYAKPMTAQDLRSWVRERQGPSAAPVHRLVPRTARGA